MTATSAAAASEAIDAAGALSATAAGESSGISNDRGQRLIGMSRYAEIVQQLTLVALRGSVTAAKFLLTLYITRVLGLADLGIYGLIAGGTTIVPALFGLGITDWVSRAIVNLPSREAIPYMASRVGLSVAVHLVGQPSVWLLNYALGTPIPWHLVALAGSILFLEHVVSDAQDLLIFRGRVYFASIVLFVRAGLWPLAVMLWAWLDPAARTLDHLLVGWLTGLLVAAAMLAALLVVKQRWRLLGLRVGWLVGCIRNSAPFYLKDISGVGSLYLDRFVVSFFLGLELTGVYTFFWSFANVVNSLVLHGTMQPRIPQLVIAARDPDPNVLRRIERRVQIETASWAFGLALAAIAVMPFVLSYLGRPLLQDNVAVFYLIMLAALVRVSADCYGYMLLALHRDRAIAVISLLGAAASALLNTILIPLVGLWGAALAFLATATALLIARYSVSRDPRTSRKTP